MKHSTLRRSPDTDCTLLRHYKRIVVQAARDLAAFTRQGLYAHEIVDLAHRCEEYEILRKQSGECLKRRKRLDSVARELRNRFERLCSMAEEIWPAPHEKSRLYSFPGMYRSLANRRLA